MWRARALAYVPLIVDRVTLAVETLKGEDT
jgi:hypothetical protein